MSVNPASSIKNNEEIFFHQQDNNERNKKSCNQYKLLKTLFTLKLYLKILCSHVATKQ